MALEVYTAGYYLVGSVSKGDYTFEIYEWAPDGEYHPWPVEQATPKLLDEVIIHGKEAAPFTIHLRGELQFKLLDKDNYWRNRFRNQPYGQFMIKSSDPGLNFTGFLVGEFEGSKFLKQYGVRDYSCSNGLTLLKLQSNTYTSKVQLGEFLYDILNDFDVDFNVNIVMDYQHQGASGQSGIIPNQIRIIPADFVHKTESPNKYQVLMAVLEFFQLQIWQENGEWWIVQRNIRSGSPTNYKRTSGGWATSTHNPVVDILKSELRDEESEDLSFPSISTYVRQVEQRSYEFETIDPIFAQKNWDAGEPIYWPGTGNVSLTTPTAGLNFDDINPVRTQVLPRIIYGGDILNLEFKADWAFKSGLSDGNYDYSVAEIKAVDLRGVTGDQYLAKDGAWSSSQQGLEETLSVFSGSYTGPTSFNINVECDPLPGFFVGYIEITLELTGDDVFAASDPIQYEEVDLTEVEISDEKLEIVYTGTSANAQMGDRVEDSVHPNDSRLYYTHPSIEYYNGTAWTRISDWSADADDQSINNQVIKNYLSQRVSKQPGYQLQLPNDYDVDLSDRITLSDVDSGKDFIPFLIKKYRSSRRTIVQIAELKEEVGGITVSSPTVEG